MCDCADMVRGSNMSASAGARTGSSAGTCTSGAMRGGASNDGANGGECARE